jgi:hypothetical protein
MLTELHRILVLISQTDRNTLLTSSMLGEHHSATHQVIPVYQCEEAERGTYRSIGAPYDETSTAYPMPWRRDLFGS